MATRQFDLTRLAENLRGSGRYIDLADVIERQMHRVSRFADLRHAEELISLLRKHSQQAQIGVGIADDGFANTQGALLAQAIILYVRATAHGDRGRGQQLNIRKALTPEQRASHDSIVELRGRAVAHFDAEERQDWHSDRLVLMKHDTGEWEYSSPYSRTMYREDTARKLHALLSIVVPYVESTNIQSLDHLHEALLKAVASDPGLNSELEGMSFDADAFFGPGPAADEVREQLNKGTPPERTWNSITGS